MFVLTSQFLVHWIHAHPGEYVTGTRGSPRCRSMKSTTARLNGRPRPFLEKSLLLPRPMRFAILEVLGSGRDVGEFAQLPGVVVGV